MLLRCNETWTAGDTGSRYEAGNIYDIADAKAGALYHTAPEGTFDVVGGEPPGRGTVGRTVKPAPAEVPEAAPAAPDRRMRGGKVRRGGKR